MQQAREEVASLPSHVAFAVTCIQAFRIFGEGDVGATVAVPLCKSVFRDVAKVVFQLSDECVEVTSQLLLVCLKAGLDVFALVSESLGLGIEAVVEIRFDVIKSAKFIA